MAFRVLVKDVKEKKLPDLTDEWAAESSEFETVDALRDDLRARIARVRVLQAQMALRESAVAALVGLVDDDEVPESWSTRRCASGSTTWATAWTSSA